MVMHGDQDPSELYVHDDVRVVHRPSRPVWVEVEPGKVFNVNTKETAVLDPETGLWKVEIGDSMESVAVKTDEHAWDVKCSACGKCMRDPESKTCIIGVCLSFESTANSLLSEKFLREQFGVFSPPEGERKIVYKFCYECWLKSLMGADKRKIYEGWERCLDTLREVSDERDRLRRMIALFLEAWDRRADWESRHEAVDQLRKQS